MNQLIGRRKRIKSNGNHRNGIGDREASNEQKFNSRADSVHHHDDHQQYKLDRDL